MPELFLPISDNIDTESKRVTLVTDFHWSLDKNVIVVDNKVYQKKNNGDLNSKIPFWDKKLVIDDKDRINLDNGQVINESDYNEYVHTNTITQIDFMYGLSIGMLKSQGMEINDNTTIKEILEAVISSNVIDSDNRGKFAE